MYKVTAPGPWVLSYIRFNTSFVSQLATSVGSIILHTIAAAHKWQHTQQTIAPLLYDINSAVVVLMYTQLPGGTKQNCTPTACANKSLHNLPKTLPLKARLSLPHPQGQQAMQSKRVGHHQQQHHTSYVEALMIYMLKHMSTLHTRCAGKRTATVVQCQYTDRHAMAPPPTAA